MKHTWEFRRFRVLASALAGLFCLAVALLPASAVQAEGEWEITSFDAVVTVDESGTLDVEEHISGNFLVEKHGIFRSIPIQYEDEKGNKVSIDVSVLDVSEGGEPVNYEVYREGALKTIKIGEADVTRSGPFAYVIRYRVDRAILFMEDRDELYWNVTGTEWDVAIPQASAIVNLPPGSEPESSRCYTGYYGSASEDCAITGSGSIVRVASGDYLTVAIAVPKGVIAEPSDFAKFMQFLKDNWDYFLLFLPVAAFVGLFLYWLKHGRDPKGRGVVVAEYEPVDNLRPTEIGTLIDARFHPKDLSAAIVDLAVRGYLTIEEKKEGKLFKSTKYTLHTKKAADEALEPFEKSLLTGIFSGKDSVTLEAEMPSFLAAKKTVEKSMYSMLAERGYFVKNPNTVRGTFIGIGVAILFGGFFAGAAVAATFERPTGFAAFIATAIFFFIFGSIMSKMTPKGAEALEKAKGFKLYLATAEKYRIQWQEKEGIFEKFLPYAMVFGVADKWSNVLADQAKEKPDWYTGTNLAAFNAVNFSHSMNSMAAAAGASMAPKSSGGSHGGGFSGGGFGGGGGGSW